MAHKGWIVAVIVIIIVLGGAAYFIFTFDISAVQNPGGAEASIAGTMRDWYVDRAARSVPAPTVPNNAFSVAQGQALYAMACAQCHGEDGRKPVPMGHAMNPRVPNLSSHGTQEMSDQELFWTIKNGIRFSGMPGFANLNSDQEIWQMTYYIRSLGKPAK